MSQPIIGIDLGSHTIKMSVFERSFREFTLVDFVEQAIPQGTRLTRDEAMASALRMMLDKNPVPLENVAVTYPAHLLSLRVLELPFTNPRKIEQTFEFELENYTPLPLEELLVDYHILSIDEEKSRLLTAYVQRTRFMKYLEALQTAGVDPRYVGVDAIDLSHVAQVSMVPQEGVYALVDIGHDKTNICVMNGLKLEYVRSVPLGGSEFTRVLQKAFKLNPEKAEALKLDRGRVSSTDQGLDQVSINLKNVAEQLVAFVRQTYQGYKQIYGNIPWQAIYLCGGGSKLAGLPEMISSLMRLSVVHLESLAILPHKIQHPEQVREIIPQSLSEGLKIIFSNRAIKINFRRGEFAFQRDIQALSGEFKQVAFWIILVAVLGLGNFMFSYYTLNQKIAQMDTAVTTDIVKAFPELKSGTNPTTKKLLTTLNAKNAEVITKLETLNPGSLPRFSEVLLEISRAMPPKAEVVVDIDLLSFTGDHLKLDGRTVSFEAGDKVRNALASSPIFKNVTGQNSKGVKDEIKFTVSMDIVAPEAPTEAPPAPEKKADKKEEET